MLGIIVSLPWELKSLTRQTLAVGTCRRITDDTLVALSGIGAERAYTAGILLISRGATALLSWGCAAALDDRLEAGSVVLPKRVIGSTGENYPVNVEWHRRLCETLSAKYTVCTDALIESATIVKTRNAKLILAQRTQAIATDMESGAQARLAHARRMPFVVVRTIIDTAATQLPEDVMRALDHRGDIKAGCFIAGALFRPADWIPLMKLAIRFNAARKTLKKASAPVLDASRVHLNCLSADVTSTARL
jgi:adenosylhomocysteine nucleosidase